MHQSSSPAFRQSASEHVNILPHAAPRRFSGSFGLYTADSAVDVSRVGEFLDHMKLLMRQLAAVLVLVTASCVVQKPYHVSAHRPKNPDAVKVKVSLSNQAVYVVEGERVLLAAATCVGTPSHPTPKGDFRIFNKIARKRSGSYGYYVKDGTIEPAQAGKGTGKYVGYPMAWWCEFHPAYGFHHGWVWPEPRTHGCLRLHETVAPKFYHLVKEGTPVNVAETQSLDQTAGKNLPRPQDYRNDDPAPEIMISDKAFKPLPEPLFVD
ncbi:MAG: hypothetical protein RIS92_2483 [Verrucomicrobiota bacterium]